MELKGFYSKVSACIGFSLICIFHWPGGKLELIFIRKKLPLISKPLSKPRPLFLNQEFDSNHLGQESAGQVAFDWSPQQLHLQEADFKTLLFPSVCWSRKRPGRAASLSDRVPLWNWPTETSTEMSVKINSISKGPSAFPSCVCSLLHQPRTAWEASENTLGPVDKELTAQGVFSSWLPVFRGFSFLKYLLADDKNWGKETNLHWLMPSPGFHLVSSFCFCLTLLCRVWNPLPALGEGSCHL